MKIISSKEFNDRILKQQEDLASQVAGVVNPYLEKALKRGLRSVTIPRDAFKDIVMPENYLTEMFKNAGYFVMSGTNFITLTVYNED